MEAQKERLRRNLASWGYNERPVPGDNNCQFHAIADQVHHRTESYAYTVHDKTPQPVIFNNTEPFQRRTLILLVITSLTPNSVEVNRSGSYVAGGMRIRLNANVVRALIVRWMAENGSLLMDEDDLGEDTTFQHATGCWSQIEWEAYLAEMSIHGTTWGDEATLLAACALFEAECVVISSLKPDCIHHICTPTAWNCPPPKRIIHIAHYAEFHYASVQYSEKAMLAAELNR